jgi:hypothetical protein
LRSAAWQAHVSHIALRMQHLRSVSAHAAKSGCAARPKLARRLPVLPEMNSWCEVRMPESTT